MAEHNTANGSSQSADSSPADTSHDKTEELADEISRIVSFLDTRRSQSNERTSGLAQEMAQRREVLAAEVSAPVSTAEHREARAVRTQSASAIQISNPALAVRYHSFCQELDEMMDGFRARVSRSKPRQH